MPAFFARWQTARRKRRAQSLAGSRLRIVGQVKPRAVMLENVRGILDAVFDDFRTCFARAKELDGYVTDWKLLSASDFGVSQLRPRVFSWLCERNTLELRSWPASNPVYAQAVGERIYDLMTENGWRGARRWRQIANEIAPTIVGGSLKHGGPDCLWPNTGA